MKTNEIEPYNMAVPVSRFSLNRGEMTNVPTIIGRMANMAYK
jgi:hypothetical protein